MPGGYGYKKKRSLGKNKDERPAWLMSKPHDPDAIVPCHVAKGTGAAMLKAPVEVEPVNLLPNSTSASVLNDGSARQSNMTAAAAAAATTSANDNLPTTRDADDDDDIYSNTDAAIDGSAREIAGSPAQGLLRSQEPPPQQEAEQQLTTDDMMSLFREMNQAIATQTRRLDEMTRAHHELMNTMALAFTTRMNRLRAQLEAQVDTLQTLQESPEMWQRLRDLLPRGQSQTGDASNNASEQDS
ncbi:hypothetical protein Micbo1qcDRAFT_206408 [Microdochium bolleyi]|uniref:Uncharacterized protein n=1 Tax=Microdochium bolleyi TaxID=196109 RepID=A0A136IX46_9PEZI|nr:hypothetical protein Micbo1qcDRAFT_206408 [Microdochium bolleyi]